MKRATYGLVFLSGILVQVAWATPSPVSVTPNSGSGAAQTFAFVFSDPGGASQIVSAQMDISASLVSANACYLYYSHTQNQIFLQNDAGTGWQAPLTIGVAGTSQNSQCSVNSGTSSVSTSGNNLTVNLALSFLPAYAGSKHIYMEAYDTADSGWSSKGTWTVGPGPVSVTPNAGSGSAQTFAFVFSDPSGAINIASAQMDISASLVAANACYLYYSRASNQIFLQNDAGTGWQASLTIGVAGTLQNSQCSVNSGTSSVSTSGNNLTLNLALSFLPAYAGSKNIYMEVLDVVDSGWSVKGTWTVSAAGSPDFTLAVSPSSQAVLPGGGTSYTATITSVNSFSGAVTLSASGLPSGATAGFSTSPLNVSANSQASSTLTITTTSGAQTGTFSINVQGTSGALNHSTAASLTVSTAATLSKEYIHLGSRVIAIENSPVIQTASLEITPVSAALQPRQTQTFSSAIPLNWALSSSLSNPGTLSTSGPSLSVTYTPPNIALTASVTLTGTDPSNSSNHANAVINFVSPPLSPDSVTPSSGTNGALETPFTFTGTDSNVAGISTSTYALGMAGAFLPTSVSISSNPPSPSPNGCWWSATPTILYLATDAGAFTGANSGTFGSGTVLSNSQCKITLAGARASVSGSTISITVPVTFMPSYSGALNIWENVTESNFASGWMPIGTWNGLQITPSTASLQPRQTQSFTSSTALTWSLAGSLSSPGTLSTIGPSSSVVYTPPNVPLTGVMTLTGKNPSNTSEMASVAIHFVSPPLSLGTVTAAGSGLSQTFTFTGTDGNSAGISTSTYGIGLAGAFLPTFMSLNANATAATSPANGCWWASNLTTIYLASDAGVYDTFGTFGSGTTLHNSQCSISLATATASTSGSTITVKVPVTFSSAYGAGPLNVWENVSESSFLSGWGLIGAWNVVQALQITPASASLQPRQTQTFTSNVAVNWSLSSSLSPAGTLSPSGASTSVTYTPPNVALTAPVTLTGTDPNNSSNHASATINFVTPPLSRGIVNPSGSSGFSQTFTFTGTDGNVAGISTSTYAIGMAGAFLPTSVSVPSNGTAGPSGCWWSSNLTTIYLASDAGAYSNSGTFGSSTILTNSQCSISLATATATTSGSTITVKVPVTFTSAYAGALNVWENVTESNFATGWGTIGSWTVLQITPASASLQPRQTQTFTSNVAVNWSLSSSLSSPGTLSTAGPSTSVIYTPPTYPLNAPVTLTGTDPNNASNHVSTTINFASPPLNRGTVSPSGSSGFSQTFTFTFTDGDVAGFNTSSLVGVAGALVPSSLTVSPTNSTAQPNGCWWSANFTSIYLGADAGGYPNPPGTFGSSAALSNSQCSINMTGATISISGSTITVRLPVTFANTYAGALNVWTNITDSSFASNWGAIGSWTVPVESVSTPAVPTGTSSGTIGTAYTYTASGAVDSYGYAVQYQFTWGDGSNSGWLAAGTTTASHTWNSVGSYSVTVQARSGTHTSVVSASSTALTTTRTDQVPVLVSFGPSGSHATTQTFTMVVNDLAGISNINFTQAIFSSTSTLSTTNSCHIQYYPSTNVLYLDGPNGGNNWAGGNGTPGSAGSLSNGQCQINLASSSASLTATRSTLNVSVTFLVTGTRYLFLWASNQVGSVGWTGFGSWGVP